MSHKLDIRQTDRGNIFVFSSFCFVLFLCLLWLCFPVTDRVASGSEKKESDVSMVGGRG